MSTSALSMASTLPAGGRLFAAMLALLSFRATTASAMADVWPVADRIIADPGGYLWLERFEAPEGPSGSWVVVDGTGAVVAEPTLPDGLQLLEVERERIISIWTDELDRQHVRVHALRREPSQRETPLFGCS